MWRSQPTRIKLRVLVDGGVGLNIYSLKLIKSLRIFEDNIEKVKGITIRTYDYRE